MQPPTPGCLFSGPWQRSLSLPTPSSRNLEHVEFARLGVKFKEPLFQHKSHCWWNLAQMIGNERKSKRTKGEELSEH